MNKEIWKDVVGYEGYYKVSNLGRVKSLDREVRHKSNGVRIFPGRILKGEITYQGYRKARLSKFGKTKNVNVHRLVAEAFIGKYPQGKVINHIDEIKDNNRVENLEYVTQKENINHGTGAKRSAESQSMRVRATHIETGEVLEFPSMSQAERQSNGFFHSGHISATVRGQHKHHKGYEWERVGE